MNIRKVLVTTSFATFCFAAALPVALQAQGAPQAEAKVMGDVPLTPEQLAEIRSFEAKAASLKGVTGRIDLPAAKASLNVPEGYMFLNPTQMKTLLVDLWGNPPESVEGVLGGLVQKDADIQGNAWAAVITYAADGYVTSDDAADIEPAKMLQTMQADQVEGNKERQKQGYPTISLLGWAEPPTFDAATHRVYWGERLKFDDSPDEGLNYRIRILGREGYLVMNFVAGAADLAAVKQSTPAVLSMASFNPGARYEDFKEGDKKAGYGLAGLIAGAAAVGVAKKVGLIGILLAFAKKGFVLIIAFVAVALNWLKGMFASKKTEEEPEQPSV